MFRPLSTTIAIAALFAAPVLAGQGDTVRRFALVIGANDGGTERARLRFAQSDAKAVAGVLVELGGVAPADAEVLLEPSAGQLRRTIQRIGQRIGAVKARRTELLVYYSGHSDEDGLLLAGERVGYSELRSTLRALDVDVRIGILDSCASGALTRSKGGVRKAPFLIDESSQVTGHAFLTSASATEAAQESDRLGGSFFTHYLISGLRGAADASGDGRVTLNEAYEFAFDETLARTEKTRQGPQHPSYDIQLAGSGDLVMTDLRVTATGILLDKGLHGRVFVHDSDRRLVAELFKASGRTVELGLESGEYRVAVFRDNQLYEAHVTVGTRYRSRVADDDLDPVAQEVARLRGNPQEPERATEMTELEQIMKDAERRLRLRAEWKAAQEAAAAEAGEQPAPQVARAKATVTQQAEPEYRVVPFHVTVLPGLHGDDKIEARFALSPLVSAVDRINGTSLAVGANIVTENARGALAAVGANIVTENARGALVSAGANIVGGNQRGTAISAGANIAGGQVRGVQASSGANIAGGGLRGVQLSSGVNIARGEVVGGQAAAGFNIAGPILGPQAAAGFNVAYGNARVAQAAAGFNWAAGTMTGVQAAAGFNWAAEGISGLQLSAGANRAGGQSTGVQAAVVNVASELKGAQVGMVNIAGKIRGLQLGLINVAEDVDGVSIAPLNFIKNGRRYVDYWVSPNEYVNLSLRFGGRTTYTLLSVGFQSPENPDRWYAALGFGGRIDLDPAFIAFDLSGGAWYEGFDFENDQSGPQNLRAQLRVFAGMDIFWDLGVFVGVSANAAIGFNGEDIALRDVPQVVRHEPDATIRYYPSLFVGVQI